MVIKLRSDKELLTKMNPFFNLDIFYYYIHLIGGYFKLTIQCRQVSKSKYSINCCVDCNCDITFFNNIFIYKTKGEFNEIKVKK